jgi:hypothetical protein
MSSQKIRRVLNVFLASPGDVFLERDIAVDVVDRFNKVFGPKLGCHIDLHRWEDTKPAYGRPQSIINPAVDDCELFIGLLWERWGQPTGLYTSGFDEEFQRAKARRESTGEPEIWLVFKAPRSDKVEDPGSELTKVLAFRDAQRSSGQVLYREIKDPDDWRRNLFDWLFEHLWEQVAPIAQTVQQPPAEPPSALQHPVVELGDAPTLEAPKQLIELSDKVARVVASGKLELSGPDANSLSEFEIARLYLLSATWMALRYTSNFIGTHEINLLYKHRSQLEITTIEEFQLLRTVLRDTSDVNPGWFWLRNAFPNGPLETLLHIASEDIDDSLRVCALKLLTSARIKTPQELWPLLPLSDSTENVSAEALRYLGFTGDESALDLIEKTAQSEDRRPISTVATEAKIQILIRVDPRQAFSKMVATIDRPSRQLTDAFAEFANALPTADLVRGAESSGSALRTFSVAELARRGELQLDLAERLRDDPVLEIKQSALQVIINARGTAELEKLLATTKPDEPWGILSGKKEVDAKLVELNYYKTLPAATLLEQLDWLSVDSPVAYKALALGHFEQISELIRSDLENGFARIREKSFEEMESEAGREVADQVFNRLTDKNLEDFIRSQHAEAALTGLASHCQSSDIEIARKYLRDENQSIKTAAVTIVSKFGDDRDVRSLLDISEGAWGEVADLAPMAAIHLSAKPDELAIEMAQSASRAWKKAAVRWLATQDSATAKQYFRALLNDTDEDNRVQGIQYLSKRLSRKELERLLDEYPSQGTYYYNVVTWLDRLLYAPSSLKEMFTRDLDQEVGATE